MNFFQEQWALRISLFHPFRNFLESSTFLTTSPTFKSFFVKSHWSQNTHSKSFRGNLDAWIKVNFSRTLALSDQSYAGWPKTHPLLNVNKWGSGCGDKIPVLWAGWSGKKGIPLQCSKSSISLLVSTLTVDLGGEGG